MSDPILPTFEPDFEMKCKSCGKEIKFKDAAAFYTSYLQDKNGVKFEIKTQPVCSNCFFEPEK